MITGANKGRVHSLVVESLLGKKICNRCSATNATMSELCEADAGEDCEGQRAISQAFALAGARVGVR